MLIGLAIGVYGNRGLTRYLSSFLYGVKPDEPATFVLVSTILATAALLASCPARRAVRIDPMLALRHEHSGVNSSHNSAAQIEVCWPKRA